MIQIKLCEHNSSTTDEIINKLKGNFSDVSIVRESCLGQCGACADSSFVLINNEVVKYSDAEDLINKIKDLL
ncbi:hypothetical protein CFOLD11_44030 [Clostridium folliculivorans]|uniref:DUF1450 domain-containing protein n=1 Tax=Clostridium folliculivorans TaxID=2886038 RepID=A0A9W5Y6E0_9CLOT|nr:YuzB family protein [Clostridium folliculivorans]GKU27576.1 hypothetical protein CFOLD11_44030 [Clostridium folliculivorans]